jgi:hypothetical protein
LRSGKDSFELPTNGNNVMILEVGAEAQDAPKALGAEVTREELKTLGAFQHSRR